MISVLICDDHPLVRYGIASVLEAYGEFRLVGAVGDGSTAVEVAKREQPDVVLMDLLMPCMNGVEATREIRRVCPNSQVLLLTSHEGEQSVLDALHAGAISYLFKDTPPADLVRAIERAAVGESTLAPRVASAMVRALSHPPVASRDGLSERETEVLSLIADGLNNSQIADQLKLSEKTIKNHVSNLLSKLKLNDRTQAAVYAWRNGLKQ